MQRTAFKPRRTQVSIRDLLTFSVGISVGLALLRTPLVTAFAEAELSQRFLVATVVWLVLILTGGIIGVVVGYFEHRRRAEKVSGFCMGSAMGLSIPLARWGSYFGSNCSPRSGEGSRSSPNHLATHRSYDSSSGETITLHRNST
jgi:hypothetical protein